MWVLPVYFILCQRVIKWLPHIHRYKTALLLVRSHLIRCSLTTGVLISSYPGQEGNKLQRQKILSFIYPIYIHNWRNISTIYIYMRAVHKETDHLKYPDSERAQHAGDGGVV